jgi:ActR/RegA family two-component response regulator
MPKARLLIVDNDTEFLKLKAEQLTGAGYAVVTATGEDGAIEVLARDHVDIAIVDLHLIDERDRKDWSGIQLAKNVCRDVPTIILTGYPRTDPVVEAFRATLQGQAAVMDFINKRDGIEALLDCLDQQLRRRVFIAHGHDDHAKQAVARFVERLSLRAIVLGEQPGMGRTVIEKFEDHSNVLFAIVLLTPDDVGGPRDDRETPARLNPRARQNVVFELGFFVGKLGRGRVAVLYKDDVEIPSDYKGVSYIEMTSGDSWKRTLAQGMKQAGLAFELARVV